MTGDLVLVKIGAGLYTSSGGVWNVTQESRVSGNGWFISGMNWLNVNCGPHKSVKSAANEIGRYYGERVVVRESRGDNVDTCPFCGSAMKNSSSVLDGVVFHCKEGTGNGCLHSTPYEVVASPVRDLYEERFMRGRGPGYGR